MGTPSNLDCSCTTAPNAACPVHRPNRVPEPKTIEAVILSAEARRFWEQVYIASLELAHQQRSVSVPWSERAGEIADHAVERWRERFDPKASE